MRELAEQHRRAREASCSATRGKVVTKASSGRATTWSTTPTAAARSSTRRGRDLGYEPAIDLDEGLRRSLIWYGGQPRSGGGLMSDLRRRHRLRRPRQRRVPGRASGTTSSASTSTRPRWRAINRGVPPIHEEGLEELLRKHLGRRFTRDDGPARPRCSAPTSRSSPWARRSTGARSTSRSCAQTAREIGEAPARQGRLPRRRRQEHRRPRHDRHRRARRCSKQASGKRAGEDFGVGMNPEFLTEGAAVARLHAPRPHRARRHRRAHAWTSLAALYAPLRRTCPRSAPTTRRRR